MRLSWYANSKVAVFSIWQGNRCTGTFRLPFADLTRMVQGLQAGPPPAGVPAGPGYGEPGYGEPSYGEPGYGQEHEYPATSSYNQPAPAEAGYDSTATYYQGQGQEYGSDQEYAGDQQYHGGQQYQSGQEYAGGQEYHEPEYGEPEYAEGGYQGGHSYPADSYGADSYGDRGPGYGDGDQGYGPDTDADQPYGDHPYGQHGQQDDFPADPGYGRVGRHGAPSYDEAPPYDNAPSYDSYDSTPGGHRASYPMPDYDPPASSLTQPDLPRTQRAWSDSGWSEEPGRTAPGGFETAQPDLDPLRPREAESAPDPAMMSFPSVPARNGPAGYR